MSTKAQQIRKEDPETGGTELPEGWATAPLLDLCDLLRGVSYEKGEASPIPAGSRIALLRANNIDGDLKFSDLQYVPKQRVSPEQILRVGDVVLAMSSGSKAVVGKAASLDQPWSGTFGAFCGVLRPSTHLNRRYFALYFQTRGYRDFISEISAGVNINNLKREYFQEIQFPVAPTTEQQRIAERVDELLHLVTSTRERFNKASVILKQFRQSVLAAACSGKLTEDWRGDHSDIENGKQLIARLLTAGTAQQSPAEMRDCDITEIPETWGWTSLDTLIIDGPQNGMYKPQSDYGQGSPIIRIEDYQNDFVRPRSELSKLRVSKEESEKYAVHVNDLLVNRVNSPSHIGKCLLVPSELCPAVFESNIMRFSVAPDINPVWIALYLRSNAGKSRLTAGAKWAVNQVSINQTDVVTTPVPIPPKLEQQEIVRRVEALFKLSDAIEKRVTAASLQAERLTQAILAKAFRGELVPTEAELARREGRVFQPASVLLERIRAERAAAEQKRSKRGPKAKEVAAK